MTVLHLIRPGAPEAATAVIARQVADGTPIQVVLMDGADRSLAPDGDLPCVAVGGAEGDRADVETVSWSQVVTLIGAADTVVTW